MYIETVPNRGSRPAYLLRETKREGARVVKHTLANLSKLPDDAIATLRQALKGVKLCVEPAEAAVQA